MGRASIQAVLNSLPNDRLLKLLNERAESGLRSSRRTQEAKQADQLEAQTKLSDATQAFSKVDSNINSIKTAVDANGNLVMQNILTDPAKQNAAKALMAAFPTRAA